MGMTAEQRERIWSHTDGDGMAVPCVDGGPYAVHFGELPSEIRMGAFRWLLLNARTAGAGEPGAYITSHELCGLLGYFTGITMTETQVREALLLLGTEPWDTASGGWTYRVTRGCPCASIALDGEGGIKQTDRSCHVAEAFVQ